MTHDQQESEKKGKALLDERAALMAKVQKARELRNRNNAAPEEDGADEASPLKEKKKKRARPASRGYLPGASASGSAMGGSSIRKKDQAG